MPLKSSCRPPDQYKSPLRLSSDIRPNFPQKTPSCSYCFSRQSLTGDKAAYSMSSWSHLSEFLPYPESPESDSPQRERLNWETKGKAIAKGVIFSSFICLFHLYFHLPMLNHIVPTISCYASVSSGKGLSVLKLGYSFYP